MGFVLYACISVYYLLCLKSHPDIIPDLRNRCLSSLFRSSIPALKFQHSYIHPSHLLLLWQMGLSLMYVANSGWDGAILKAGRSTISFQGLTLSSVALIVRERLVMALTSQAMWGAEQQARYSIQQHLCVGLRHKSHNWAQFQQRGPQGPNNRMLTTLWAASLIKFQFFFFSFHPILCCLRL